MKSLALVTVLCLMSVEASRVRKCNSGTSPVEDSNINMAACAKLPCKLKKSTSVDVEMKFTPKNDVTKLTNSVHANILGIPFPFIGVDGNSVCEKLYDTTGAKAGCPLKAGKEYIYKDAFPVLDVYPQIKVWVHWSLVDNNGDSNVCFEVPVKITS